MVGVSGNKKEKRPPLYPNNPIAYKTEEEEKKIQPRKSRQLKPTPFRET